MDYTQEDIQRMRENLPVLKQQLKAHPKSIVLKKGIEHIENILQTYLK